MSDTCSPETCDVASGLDDFNVSTSSLDAAPFADPSPLINVRWHFHYNSHWSHFGESFFVLP